MPKLTKSRREFLRHGLFGFAGLGLATSLGRGARASLSPTAHDTGLPVLQGYTDESSAQFKVLVDDPSLPLEIQVNDATGTSIPVRVLSRIVNPYDRRDEVLHLEVAGLSLGVDYHLNFIDPKSRSTFDSRVFRALDLNGSKVRFAALSCMNDFFAGKQVEMWEALAQSKPDVIFLLGDTCYTDFGSDGSASDFWRRHMETRRSLDQFRWKRLVPTLAIWDDHDFGGNNVDSNNPLRNEALACFGALFESVPADGLEKGPGVAKIFHFRGQRFFLMDCRFFRESPGPSGASHWGIEQEEWLLAKIAESTEPAWILNGSMFFGDYMDKDSFAQKHPDQLRRILAALGKLSAPVVFVSGDVHFSEIMEIEPEVLGYKTFELVSSSMHSFTFPFHQHRFSNPRRFDSTWHHNFFVVDSMVTSRGGMEMRVRSIGGDSDVFFDHRLRIDR